MATRKRRRKDSPLDNISNIVTAGALVIIAILLVVFVVLYIKNNLSFSGLLPGGEAALPAESAAETEGETAAEEQYGLVALADGSLAYALTGREAASYDDEYVLVTEDGRKLLKDSFLDFDGGLYHFDEEGRAKVSGEYSERAFRYHFDESGRLDEISYNSRYSGENEELPGLYKTKSLSVYIDEEHRIGNYTALMYKKATSLNAEVLGSEAARQYASPYAYEIVDNRIYFLAVSDAAGSSAEPALTDAIEGKVFMMSAGADTRYIYASGSYGFKALEGSDGKTVVYSYDGEKVTRSDTSEKDESMIVFTEDMDYLVSVSEDKAYLTLSSGIRVSMQSSSFKAGNFTYELSPEGEILSVKEKTTVNTGGYTYYVQHGTSFGTDKSRVIRQSSDGTDEIISSEFDGTTFNLHYDYDSSAMIAEYLDTAGRGGLVRISLDGDVDVITEAAGGEGSVTLYAIQDSTAVIRGADGSFYTARLNVTTPIAVAVDPQAAVTAETPAAETSSAPVLSEGPGEGDTGNEGVIIPEALTETGIGPGGG